MTTRRHLLTLAAAGGIAAVASRPRLAFASAPTDKRLVVVILRGAMDGLSAVPPIGDPDYERARAGLALPPAGSEGGVLQLDGHFGLHPSLANLHRRYGAGELLVIHAAASPYRDRSHFDGQNVLEGGGGKPYGQADGWLNRSLAGLPAALRSGRKEMGVALSPVMPLISRGPASFASWSPSVLPDPGTDLVARVKALYAANDPALARALAGAVEANADAGPEAMANKANDLTTLATTAARFLSDADGPCVAVLDTSGWDTHANQDGLYGALRRNLTALDGALDALATGMGPMWSQTAVLVMTEFGRTVAMNGNRGTDHGEASAAFLLGGGVAGGRVLTDWPGLKPAQLYEARDLKPTTDLYAVARGVLRDHLGVEPAYLDRNVFPQAAGGRTIDGLFRRA